jgi:hypothetical protein
VLFKRGELVFRSDHAQMVKLQVMVEEMAGLAQCDHFGLFAVPFCRFSRLPFQDCRMCDREQRPKLDPSFGGHAAVRVNSGSGAYWSWWSPLYIQVTCAPNASSISVRELRLCKLSRPPLYAMLDGEFKIRAGGDRLAEQQQERRREEAYGHLHLRGTNTIAPANLTTLSGLYPSTASPASRLRARKLALSAGSVSSP